MSQKDIFNLVGGDVRTDKTLKSLLRRRKDGNVRAWVVEDVNERWVQRPLQ